MATTLICSVVVPTLPSTTPTGFPIAHLSCVPGPLDLMYDFGGGNQGAVWFRDTRKLTNSGNGQIERQEAPGFLSEASAMEGTEIYS